MSTTMVGDELGQESLTVETDGSEKESEKGGLINSFFQPRKQKTKLNGASLQLAVNSVKGSNKVIDIEDCTEIVTDCNSSEKSSPNQSEKISDTKSYNLFREGRALKSDCRKKSSQKELNVVSSAVQKSLEHFSSSGSDFEEGGKTVFATQYRGGKKGIKKSETKIRSNKKDSGIGESKEKSLERNVDKKTKDVSKARKLGKNKGRIGQGNDACDYPQSFSCSERSVSCVDIENKESKTLGLAYNSTSSSCETKEEERTCAFSILMKSQREQSLQKFDHSSTETGSVDAVDTSSETTPVAVVDQKLLLKENISCPSESMLPKQSITDSNGTVRSSETNAFDLLMKKGKLDRTPFDADCQKGSQLDAELGDNSLCSSQKKHKKKPFEFQLSIRASKKMNLEISFDSDNLNVTEDSSDLKKQRQKHKKVNTELFQGMSDDNSNMEEKHQNKVKVSKSKRKQERMKGRDNTAMDTADDSLTEGVLKKEEETKDKKTRKSKRKSGSTANIAPDNIVLDEALDDKDFQTPAKSGGRSLKHQMYERDNNTEVKGKNAGRQKEKATDSDFSTEQATSTETKQGDSGRISEGIQDGSKSEMRAESNMELLAYDSAGTAANQSEKSDERRERAVNEDVNKEPRALAAIFLKKRVNPVPREENRGNSESSSANEHKGSHIKLSQVKETTTEEKEAAKKAFNALFTGTGTQRTVPVASMSELLPAPWPSVSHVLQKGEQDSMGNDLWCLPWPDERGHRFQVLKHGPVHDAHVFDSIITASSTHEDVMFCGLKDSLHSQMLDMETTQISFPEAVIKKLLLELAFFYPGVPLRKLYKRYSTKQHKVLSTTGEAKQVIPEKQEGDKASDSKTLPVKKGGEKRKFCSDGGICQENKIAKKVNDFSATQLSDDLLQLAGKTCKKRAREDDNEEPKEMINGRRLSTRLKEKRASVESNSLEGNLPKSVVSSHKTKRRKTTDLQEDSSKIMPSFIPQEKDKTEDEEGVVSNNATSLVDGFVSDSLWTDFYRPVLSSEVMSNASAVSKLRHWLEEWKIKREKTLRKELQQQKRLLAKQKGKSASSCQDQGSCQSVEWWDADSDSDFQVSDDASDDSDSEGGSLSTAMFIMGPTGVGKTSMVYACAEELGYKVFEVNSSSKRSGKQILSQLEEATQSHLVINQPTTTASKGLDPGSSFAGLFDKAVVNSSRASGPISAFLQPAGSSSHTKDNKVAKESKGKNGKRKKDKLKEKPGKSILKQPSQVDSKDGEESNLSSKAASLILFEEVDVIFEEDKSFWFAVSSFMQNAKCPIVLISTESQVRCEGRFDQIILKPPSVNLLSAHLQLVGLVNNIFINPEDLQSLVARNNCDIRKCLLNLQFWVVSGGGFKAAYKRPPGLKDKSSSVAERCENSERVSVDDGNSAERLIADLAPSQDKERKQAAVISVLADEGEESMFLSLSDWQAIKDGSLRPSSRSFRREGDRQTGVDNSDSDFCQPKRKMLVCADGSTDSIFEVTDTNDSQMSCNSDKNGRDSLPFPPMDRLLFESVHGLLNCVAKPAIGTLSALREEDEKQRHRVQEHFRLAHFSQGLGVDLTYTNFSAIIPLFTDSTTSQPSKKHKPVPPPAQFTEIGHLMDVEFGKPKSDNLFTDTSLFDDGTDLTGNDKDCVQCSEPVNCTTKNPEDSNDATRASFQDSTDTGFSEAQVKAETGNEKYVQYHGNVKLSSDKQRNPSNEEICSFKALEIFAQFAENMSHLDALCPSLSGSPPTSAQFGWLGAELKPGLSDEHVTVQESWNWLTRDIRADIRGALEAANLEFCLVKVKSLSQNLEEMGFSNQNKVSDNRTSGVLKNEPLNFEVLSEHLPARVNSSVLRLDAVSQSDKSVEASRRKLYKNLGPCIPALSYCNHRCVTCDYIPVFRFVCHAEKLREEARLKRRFLHYLNSNSFSMTHSTMDALADCYLGNR
ncbi:ATPase family AAA domain-containing protein 5-like isoform X1 [Montipora capricornis]|uniref:ATPase family AAA domain-containing protein 5-like isoform X1 n=1 Tax=Montipora capricornis TaxID=246305 RepID=UPI0035F1FF02